MKITSKLVIYFISACVCGALIGYASLGHMRPELLALTLLIPLFWILIDSRAMATGLVFFYYLLAARGIPIGASIFFGAGSNLIKGIILWLLATFILTLPWAILHPRNNDCIMICAIKFVWLVIAITIPPIGIIGWASPLLSIGIILPGTGWCGILIFLSFIPLTHLLFKNTNLKYRSMFMSIAIILLICIAFVMPVKVQKPQNWSSINTSFGSIASGNAGHRDAALRSASLFGEISQMPEQVKYILLPETITGAWFRASEELWFPMSEFLKLRGQTVVLGAEIFDADFRYDNSLLFLGFDAEKQYRQRIPVPVSMWVPFGGVNTAKSHVLDKGIIELKTGESAATLLCYEQFIAWPILRSMVWSRTSILIAGANLWWGKGTSIPAIQEQCISSWAALFHLKLVSAVNI